MEIEAPVVRFEEGFRTTLQEQLCFECAPAEGVTWRGAAPPAGAPLSPPDLLLCLAPLLHRWLPVETVDYHALHVEFLGGAVYRETVRFEIRVEKQPLGKGWKVVVRCRKAGGEYAAVIELLASVAPPSDPGSSSRDHGA